MLKCLCHRRSNRVIQISFRNTRNYCTEEPGEKKEPLTANEILLSILEKANVNVQPKSSKSPTRILDSLDEPNQQDNDFYSSIFKTHKTAPGIKESNNNKLKLGDNEEEEGQFGEGVEEDDDSDNYGEYEYDVEDDEDLSDDYVVIPDFEPMTEEERKDYDRLATSVKENPESMYDHDKKKSKTFDETISVILKALKEDIKGQNLNLSKFIPNNGFKLKDVYNGKSSPEDTAHSFVLEVTHDYLYKLTNAEFVEFEHNLNLHFLKKLNLRPSNLRVNFSSVRGQVDEGETPFEFFEEGKKPIFFDAWQLDEKMILPNIHEKKEIEKLEAFFAEKKMITDVASENMYNREGWGCGLRQKENTNISFGNSDGPLPGVETVKISEEQLMADYLREFEYLPEMNYKGSIFERNPRLIPETTEEKTDREAYQDYMNSVLKGEIEPEEATDLEDDDLSLPEKQVDLNPKIQIGATTGIATDVTTDVATDVTGATSVQDEEVEENKVEYEISDKELRKLIKIDENGELRSFSSPDGTEYIVEDPDYLYKDYLDEPEEEEEPVVLPPGTVTCSKYAHQYYARSYFLLIFEIMKPVTTYDNNEFIELDEEIESVEFFVKRDRFKSTHNRS